MDEVSARAEMADAVDDSRLAVTVPRSEVERVLATDEEVDLVLDVVRTNGEREERRLFLAWDREALRRLVDQSGERIVVAVDPKSLQEALDADVEAHGLREAGATLAILVTAVSGGAGMAGAAVDQQGAQAGQPAYVPFQTDFPSIEATVDTSGWQDAAEASGYGVRGTPSDVAADPAGGIENVRAGQTAPEAVSDTAAGIENVRAGREAPAEAPNPPSANVLSGVPDTAAGIENVRAERTAPDVGGSGGTSISAPSPAVSAALAGGVVLTIAGAAFALRRRREPEIA